LQHKIAWHVSKRHILSNDVICIFRNTMQGKGKWALLILFLVNKVSSTNAMHAEMGCDSSALLDQDPIF